MKKIILFMSCFLFLFSFNLLSVNATTLRSDTGDNIVMPVELLKDGTNTFTTPGLTTPTLSYQIIDVSSNAELVKKIDANIVETAKYKESLTDTTKTDAYRTELKNSVISLAYAENVTTLVDDFDDSSWTTITDTTIPTDTLTENNYYVVWVKAVAGTTTAIEYFPYKYISSSYYTSSTTTTNPKTGIEDTLLYVGVGVALIFGSALVINKNKESYE